MQNTGGGPGASEVRNLIFFVVIAAVILFGWEFFVGGPQRREQQAERARIEETLQRQEQQQAAQQATSTTAGAADGETAPPPQAQPQAPRPRDQVIAESASARVVIETPEVDGSIALNGARFDDLSLRQYRRTVERDSGEVSLLAPQNAEHAYDAYFGWEDENPQIAAIGDAAVWTAPAGARLSPQTPVTLVHESNGLRIERTIAIDDHFMFTITDVVNNTGPAPRSLRPFGVVRRDGLPEDYVNRQIVHQGFAGAFGPNDNLRTFTYHQGDKHARDRLRGRVEADQRLFQDGGQGGWLGISDHYWLAAVVPDQSEQISGYFDTRTERSGNNYRAAYRGAYHQIPAGGSISYTQHFFAGAKRVDILRGYQSGLSIPKFDEAVDWGNMMWPLTRTYFMWLLHPLAKMFGNFAIAILLSTVVIKLLLFPLVYHSFKSMAKMRAVQPKMKEVQERFAADKQRQQQEMIKLYQTEKINPVSGCLPILLQIPVFFALYKTLSVTIEMRHAPFFGTWVNDLSAPDPTSIFNLFGLLPYDPASIPFIGAMLAIGVWPILYGVSMLALQGLSPPPTDQMQAQIFRFLPILFTFMFAGFPAGLVIYWTWSNSLSIAQQYVIMRRQGVETQFDKWLAKLRAPKPAE
ncbi:membrane protein insertase YidC [Terricaulis sp.]|uniref:membrane protein insertase YidC n=1 Tax=Terricaulis sp. TaxID=2768686 RepID=UPI003783D2CA